MDDGDRVGCSGSRESTAVPLTRTGLVSKRLTRIYLTCLFGTQLVCRFADADPQSLQLKAFARTTARSEPLSASVQETKATDVLSLVQSLPFGATQAELTPQVELILAEIGRSKRAQLSSVYGALEALAEQPRVVEVLVGRFYQLPADAFSERLSTLRILGALRRSDALPFLRTLVWEPLPETSEATMRLTTRDRAELLKIKAVQSIAYVRLDETFAETMAVSVSHPSLAVRVAAISAYMWNAGDSEEAARRLYAILPQEFHKYVQRPRFTRTMRSDDFDRRLSEWRRRWDVGNPGPQPRRWHGSEP